MSTVPATVSAMPASRSDVPFPPAPATSDADGRYELDELRGGELTVLATASGWVTCWITIVRALEQVPSLSDTQKVSSEET